MRPRMALVLLAAFAGGCRPEDPIARYSAPKDMTWRMIAAVIPTSEQTYFLKAVAGPMRLEAHKDAILKFAAGVRVENGALKWTLPAGWTEEAGKGDRLATLVLGAGEPRLELSITRLAGGAGGVLANVNRWRDQLGRGPLSEAELSRLSSTVDAGGLPVTMVDFEGPRKPPAAPMAARPAQGDDENEGPSLEKVRSMFLFELPPAWTENPKPGAGRILEFHAGSGVRTALISLSVMQGDAGGLLANVNRWRNQVGLEAVDGEGVQRVIRAFTLLGHPGHYAEFPGKERAMQVAFTMGPPFSIFLKIDGSPETVGEQQAAFEAWARTLRMNR